MKRTITLIALGIATGTAFSQCTSSIPSNATTVSGTNAQTISGSNQNYWICQGAFQKIFTGNNNTIWAESGVFVSINGSGNTVNYKGSLMMGVFGSNNVLNVQAASAVSDQGSGNTINVCGANMVVFDYANAPSNGCGGVGIEELNGVALDIYPNPANDVLRIDAGTTVVEQIAIMDLEGRTVAAFPGQMRSIPVDGLAPGTYMVRLFTEEGNGTRRFMKM